MLVRERQSVKVLARAFDVARTQRRFDAVIAGIGPVELGARIRPGEAGCRCAGPSRDLAPVEKRGAA